jgi:hypothetical protein
LSLPFSSWRTEGHTFAERDDRNTGAIAGGTIGGFFALLFLVTLLVLILVITACKIKQKGERGGPWTSKPKDSGPTALSSVGPQNDLYGSPDEP